MYIQFTFGGSDDYQSRSPTILLPRPLQWKIVSFNLLKQASLAKVQVGSDCKCMVNIAPVHTATFAEKQAIGRECEPFCQFSGRVYFFLNLQAWS
jgi:hypothetical protein